MIKINVSLFQSKNEVILLELGCWFCKFKNVLKQNPLNPYFEEKVYYTGDFATLDEEGNIIFIGRKDNQIKIRGYRVELGEIESVLSRYPDITEVAVISVSENIVAYLVTKSNLSN